MATDDKEKCPESWTFQEHQMLLARAFNGFKAMYGLNSIQVTKTWDVLAHLYSHSEEYVDVSNNYYLIVTERISLSSRLNLHAECCGLKSLFIPLANNTQQYFLTLKFATAMLLECCKI